MLDDVEAKAAALDAALPAALAAALAERYAIAREIGRRGMAIVYLADDLRHQRRVAIKVVHPELGRGLGAARFLREMALAARLRHPHILPLFDSGKVTAGGPAAGEDGGRGEGLLYYVMPYVEGESLRTRLQRERQLPVDDALRIARDRCRAAGHGYWCASTT